jgi:hypothetical protein
MLESTVELLGGLFMSAPCFTDRFLYFWLDCCGSASGQPGKRYCE